MPRINIERDQTGGPVRRVTQGEISRIVVAHVTYPDALNDAVHEHQDIIWRTATGNAELHHSKKVNHVPAGAIGYIHSINNVCLAVSRINTETGTIELCGGVGHVNDGVHNL